MDTLNVQKTLTLLALALLLVGLAFVLNLFDTEQEELPLFELDQSEGATVRGPLLEESLPVRLRIPEIGVDTAFVTLGVDENREIEIPDGYDEVGWYQHGPTPGELGPAVVLGHVDSLDGPAVFFSLGQLNPGDLVEVDREDGSTAVFEVRTLERYEQEHFPVSLVYGDIDHAGLRLITCSGSFNRDTQQYDHNLVVYAELVEVIN